MRLSQAIEAKKEALLSQIKLTASARLKALDLHKEHLLMVTGCAAQMRAKCTSLLSACSSKVQP